MKHKEKKIFNTCFKNLSLLGALSILALFLGILFVLLYESYPAFERFGVIKFITSSDWNPVKESFGALTSIYGTIVVTLLSLLFAVPVAIGIAIFTTELAPNFLKTPLGMAIELLASIPSIIYGMWGFFVLSPLMRDYIEPFLQNATANIPLVAELFTGTPRGVDILTASLILSIMILPFTASIARDSFNLTRDITKESAYAIGATRWEVIKDIVLPYSKLAVMGGVLLSLCRALGETMAVAFVLGNSHRITASLLKPASTITVTLANEFAEADDPIYLSSLFYLALILFIMSFITLAIAKYVLVKGSHAHES